MPDATRWSFEARMQQARATRGADAWRALEEAHILSQPWAWPHVEAHVAMLRLALRERDRAEVRGQLVRIAVAGPGSLAGRYPVGNTGRANVPIGQPMPVPAHLAALLGSLPAR
jgi:hypothetical protein